MEDETRHSNELNVTLFDFNTIAFSTDNFANLAKLGEGGFGPVYKVKKNIKKSRQIHF